MSDLMVMERVEEQKIEEAVKNAVISVDVPADLQSSKGG